MKNLFFFVVITLLFGCSSNKIDLNKIVGSWYFVQYADEPYSKSDLKAYTDAEIQQSPAGKIKNFHYIFNADGSYEYIIYNNPINKGKYALNHQRNQVILHKSITENDTLTVKYLDGKHLQIATSETERIYIYYKTKYKFPPIEVTQVE